MVFDFANVLVFLLVAAGFVTGNLVMGRMLFRPGVHDVGEKLATYECGEPTIGRSWIRFDIRFYAVALMFVVFDVEVALLFPWGVIFRDLVGEGLGVLALAEVGVFLVILLAGLAYVWARGDIDWTPRVGERPRTTDFASRPGRAGRVVLPRGATVEPGVEPAGSGRDAGGL